MHKGPQLFCGIFLYRYLHVSHTVCDVFTKKQVYQRQYFHIHVEWGWIFL